MHEEHLDLELDHNSLEGESSIYDSDTGLELTYTVSSKATKPEGAPQNSLSAHKYVKTIAFALIGTFIIGGIWVYELKSSSFFTLNDSQGQTLGDITETMKNSFETFNEVLENNQVPIETAEGSEFDENKSILDQLTQDVQASSDETLQQAAFDIGDEDASKAFDIQ